MPGRQSQRLGTGLHRRQLSLPVALTRVAISERCRRRSPSCLRLGLGLCGWCASSDRRASRCTNRVNRCERWVGPNPDETQQLVDVDAGNSARGNRVVLLASELEDPPIVCPGRTGQADDAVGAGVVTANRRAGWPIGFKDSTGFLGREPTRRVHSTRGRRCGQRSPLVPATPWA
jgi:hypothetical protein